MQIVATIRKIKLGEAAEIIKEREEEKKDKIEYPMRQKDWTLSILRQTWSLKTQTPSGGASI